MERSLHWIRENPTFTALIAFLLINIFVGVVLATTMLRAGMSLKPLVWFFGFVAIVAIPQGTVHLLDVLVLRKNRAVQIATGPVSAPAASVSITSKANGLKPVSWEVVFGPNADPSLITDAKRGLSQILGNANEARLSFNANGESALAARFDSAEAAAKALNAYGSFFQFDQVTGDDMSGWTARRFNGQGEWNHVVTAGNELYAWTGQTRESVVANRERVLGPLPAQSATVHSVSTGPAILDDRPVSTKLSKKKGLMTVFIIINLIAAVLWFFKGTVWAARTSPNTGATPAGEAELRQRLLALNAQDLPAGIKPSSDGQSLEVNWRYADARWFDLMRAHSMHRACKLVLSFDDAAKTVRVSEYWSRFNASVGADGLRFDWKKAAGIQFFRFEHKRVFGVQLGPDGKPTGELSKAYTFNLQELKGPISDTVTGSGWTWQPLVWDAPKSLHWLTE